MTLTEPHVRRAAAAAVLVVAAACGTEPAAPEDAGPPVLNEDVAAIFPADNWWKLDVSGAPLDPASDDLVDWICDRASSNDPCDATVHPDFGPPPYGIPYIGVSGDQPLEAVTFVLYGSESDAGAPGRPEGYPIPEIAREEAGWIEGGVAGGGGSGDRHLLVVDRERRPLFELWATVWNGSEERWEAGSGAVFDLDTNDRRPEGWTSADAAGLAVLPGLVKVHEVQSGEPIRHAFRVTVRATDGYVWPASHAAGSNQDAPPMGTRLRLKASFDLSPYEPEIQRVFQAMKTYGLIVADQRLRHVCAGHDGPGLGQRRPEPRVSQPDRGPTSRWWSSAGSPCRRSHGDAGSFTDPDGFVWECAVVVVSLAKDWRMPHPTTGARAACGT